MFYKEVFGFRSVGWLADWLVGWSFVMMPKPGSSMFLSEHQLARFMVFFTLFSLSICYCGGFFEKENLHVGRPYRCNQGIFHYMRVTNGFRQCFFDLSYTLSYFVYYIYILVLLIILVIHGKKIQQFCELIIRSLVLFPVYNTYFLLEFNFFFANQFLFLITHVFDKIGISVTFQKVKICIDLVKDQNDLILITKY